jgi:tRNA(fMet)-specific endonuclease VapC
MSIAASVSCGASIKPLLSRDDRHEIPVIVVGEYRYGLAGARRRKTLLPLFEELIRESTVLPVGVETAAVYAAIRHTLRVRGTPIPENDIWISALAIEHKLDIASRDTDFDRVAGVRRHAW